MSEREDSDRVWREMQAEHAWSGPPPAIWPLRLPVIRWFRFVWNSIRAEHYASQWASVGIGIGGMNEYDRWVLYGVYRGWF